MLMPSVICYFPALGSPAALLPHGRLSQSRTYHPIEPAQVSLALPPGRAGTIHLADPVQLMKPHLSTSQDILEEQGLSMIFHHIPGGDVKVPRRWVVGQFGTWGTVLPPGY